MHYFIEGAIKQIGEVQVFSDKFKKIEFIIETEGLYPEQIKFEFVNDDVEALDTFIIGEMVTLAFVIKGNEYQEKHYVNLRAIAIAGIVNGYVEKEFKRSVKQNKEVNKLVELLRKNNVTV